MKASQSQTIAIRKAGRGDIPALDAIAAAMRHAKELNYFERNLEQQEAGSREIFIAAKDGADVAYCILNWEPKYGLFKAHGIPETQDLNVIPSCRKKGVATALIKFCEDLALKKGKTLMGISVGLDPGYGAAQILYVKLGYIPDGLGITYDRKTVGYGEFKPVDDNLCLMMTKSL